MTSSAAEPRDQAAAVLEAHWDAERGHSYPNTSRYPHQWLWDSCFTAICWAALGDARATSELVTALSDQLPGGMVPHMRYAGPTIERGPLDHVSSFTQPPVYAHAAAYMARRGIDPGPDTPGRVGRALDFLLERRRSSGGLVFVVHPWETGADDSPRWDGWMAADWEPLRWDYRRWTDFDLGLVPRTRFDGDGAAIGGSTFEAAPAAFNALTAHAALELAELTGDGRWRRRAERLAAVIDERLWDEGEGLWSDEAVVGGGGTPSSERVPTLDGVLPALVTADAGRAGLALDQLLDPARFSAPYGLAYVARDHPKYQPDTYWRGTAWMQMNYLALLAALRWERADVAAEIVRMSRRAAGVTGFAEHWNPETGEGYGATPLTWSALVVAIDQAR